MDSELEQLRLELHAAELYEEYYPLLERMAIRYAADKNDENEIDALIHMGWIGLMIADNNFKKDSRISFVSYAVLYIRRYMKLYLTEKDKSFLH